MPELETLDADDSKPVLAALARDGACIVRDLLPESLCEQLLHDFEPHLEALNWGADDLGYRDGFYGTQTKRLHGLFSKSTATAQVLTHPLLLALAETLFVSSGMSRGVRLSNAELMVLNPGQSAQVFHTDAASWPRIQTLENGEILVSANCALTDFTTENGATRVVPGSHRWPSGRAPEPHEVCLATMPRGSALVYSGNVIHSGGDNRSATTRTGLYLGYVASTLRPLENHLVTNRPEDIAALSPAAQELLDQVPGGFTVYA
ncbi:MAG: phytanoyl-CoA dioxygenase family protein [Pseudomonadota bacterium]